VVLARTAVVDGGGAEKGGWGDRFAFDDVSKAIEGVTDAVREALAKAAPDKVSVTLGFELAVKAGKLTALLVGGDAQASVAVTLEWDRAAAARWLIPHRVLRIASARRTPGVFAVPCTRSAAGNVIPRTQNGFG
jgi:hypothetical protein